MKIKARRLLYLAILLSTPLIAMEIQQETIKWPVLGSSNAIHKVIINSLVNKPQCKYKGRWFTAQQDPDKNRDLFAHQDQIKNALGYGLLVELKPTSSSDVYARFTKKCAYKIYVDGLELARFIVRVVEPELGSEHVQAIDNVLPIEVNSQVIHAGHGTFGPHVEGCVPSETISVLMAQLGRNPVLDLGFSIIEAADLANIQDPVVLATYIAQHRNNQITAADITERILHDIAVLEKVRLRLNHLRITTGGFRDQIKRLTQHNLLKRVINFIERHPEICQGTIPGELSSFSGGRQTVLRAALYYVAYMQEGLSQDFKALVHKLAGFYKTAAPNDSVIKQLLSRTLLLINDQVYMPANSYVLYADSALLVNQLRDTLPIVFEPNRSPRNLPMCFGDCTGFVSQITRQLRPDIAWLTHHRFKSRDLEIAYDVMIKEMYGTYEYRAVGRNRVLTREEIQRINGEFRGTAKLAALTAAFKPVLRRNEIQAGDIIVFRQRPNGNFSTKTGHAVIVVDPRPSRDTNLITVIECTRASETGARHGYGWRRVQLNRGGSWETRVLRLTGI